MHQTCSLEAKNHTRGKRKVEGERQLESEEEMPFTGTMDTPKYFNLYEQHLHLEIESVLFF